MMRKIEIAHRIHQAAEISEEQAGKLLDWVLELFKATFQQGETGQHPKLWRVHGPEEGLSQGTQSQHSVPSIE